MGLQLPQIHKYILISFTNIGFKDSDSNAETELSSLWLSFSLPTGMIKICRFAVNGLAQLRN
jgi:hypothetical protein